jgi:hypothetical protein
MKSVVVLMLAAYASVWILRDDDPQVLTVVLVAMFDLYAIAVAIVKHAEERPNPGRKIET